MPPPFPLTPTSSDGDPFCSQQFCDYEDIYRTRFFQLNTSGGSGTYSLNPNRDYTESIVDIDSTVYATHYWTASHLVGSPPYCAGHVVTKVSNSSTNASVVWTKQYKCGDGLLMGGDPGRVKLDIYGNLWLIYSTCSGNGTASTPGITTYGPYDFNVHFLRISKSTGALLFHKSFKVRVCDSGYQALGIEKVVHDPHGNWYIASSHVIGDATWNADFNPNNLSDPANVFARSGWVIKLDYALNVKWGVRWSGNGYAATSFDDMTYTSNILYISGRVSQSPGTSPTFFKVDTNTGIFLNFSTRDYASGVGYPALRPTPNCMATDSYGNLYAAMYNTFGYNTEMNVMKWNSSGTLLWTQAFTAEGTGNSYLDQFGASAITITSSNRIFISASRSSTYDFSGSASTYVLEITTSGQIVSTRRYENRNAIYNTIYSIHTYAYSPNTLFCRFPGGDHVDTTTNVETFNIPQRTMISLSNVQPTARIPFFRQSNSINNTWGSIHSDFVAYPTSFTVTAPDRQTQLFDAAKIRD